MNNMVEYVATQQNFKSGGLSNPYSRSPKVGNPIASILKSNV